MTFKKNIRKNKFIVSIVMGSKSDWKTLKKTAEILKKLNIKFESKIISAHRTPLRLVEFAQNAKLNNISVPNVDMIFFIDFNLLLLSNYIPKSISKMCCNT